MTRPDTRSTWRGALLVTSAALLLCVWVVPILWAVLTSLKNEKEVLAYPPAVVFATTFKNFHEVLFGPTNIIPNLISSLVIAICTTTLTVAIAVPKTGTRYR